MHCKFFLLRAGAAVVASGRAGLLPRGNDQWDAPRYSYDLSQSPKRE